MIAQNSNVWIFVPYLEGMSVKVKLKKPVGLITSLNEQRRGVFYTQ